MLPFKYTTFNKILLKDRISRDTHRVIDTKRKKIEIQKFIILHLKNDQILQ